jgi:hypothetical protein
MPRSTVKNMLKGGESNQNKMQFWLRDELT